MSDEVLCRVEGYAGRITLNRPQALNALTHGMCLAMEQALLAWRDDENVRVVIIDGAGDRAFGAGGDIRYMYETGKAGDFEKARAFWADEYRLNALINNYPKPYISLMDGIVMGGGVGVSAHGSHRIVTDTTLLAMPECGIGLIPDVGGTWLLANAPGDVGVHLAITGTRIGAADAIFTGFADFYVEQARLGELLASLCQTGDPAVIHNYVSDVPEASLPAIADEIDAVYAGTADALEIYTRLGAHGSDWAAKAVKMLDHGCPLSIACTLELVKRAREMTRVEDALNDEYRFTFRSAEEGELLEGIRAVIIDKDRNPQWKTPTLEGISPARVNAMIANLGDRELGL